MYKKKIKILKDIVENLSLKIDALEKKQSYFIDALNCKADYFAEAVQQYYYLVSTNFIGRLSNDAIIKDLQNAEISIGDLKGKYIICCTELLIKQKGDFELITACYNKLVEFEQIQDKVLQYISI